MGIVLLYYQIEIYFELFECAFDIIPDLSPYFLRPKLSRIPTKIVFLQGISLAWIVVCSKLFRNHESLWPKRQCTSKSWWSLCPASFCNAWSVQNAWMQLFLNQVNTNKSKVKPRLTNSHVLNVVYWFIQSVLKDCRGNTYLRRVSCK